MAENVVGKIVRGSTDWIPPRDYFTIFTNHQGGGFGSFEKVLLDFGFKRKNIYGCVDDHTTNSTILADYAKVESDVVYKADFATINNPCSDVGARYLTTFSVDNRVRDCVLPELREALESEGEQK